MSISRRSFLAGAGSGAVAVLLASCAPEPVPAPTPTPTVPPPRVPVPIALARSSWTSDPFSRGAISFDAVGTLPGDRATLASPIGGRLFFAGEATSTTGAGTIAGAWRSGIRVAGEVAGAGAPGERIAVVGAGIAGAEAAWRLREAGFDVTVIEARDRVGGRLHSANSESWPFPVQLGGWRVGETEAALVAELGDLVETELATIALDDEVWLTGPGTSADAVRAAGAEALATAVAWAAEQPRDIPVETALEESGARAAAEGRGEGLLDAFLTDVGLRTGAEAGALSSWFPPGDPALPLGLLDDLDEMVAQRLEGISTARSTSVVGVAYGDDGVSLRLGTGESLSVDRVVLTVPLGVLQGGDLVFDPQLPFEHRSAIGAIGVGAIETVWLRFEEPFWSTDAVVWHLVDAQEAAGTVTTWINLEPATGEAVLVGLVGGDAARHLEELDDDEVAQLATTALEAFAD